MRYTKEFKLECIKKYKNGGHIIDPPGPTHHHFHNMVLRWVHIYDILGEAGLNHDKPKLSAETIVELIERIESGESYTQVAYSVGKQAATLIKWHKIYRQEGFDGLKSLKRGKKPMTVKKSKKEKEKTELEILKEENEYLKAENEYLKKLNALVQKRKAQEPKKK
jgi:transposase-like protein